MDFEKEVIDYLGLPSMPKKEHDGIRPFKKGVAILELMDGREVCAICKFDADSGDTEPKVVKTFGIEPFKRISKIFVVPNYMSNIEDVKDMDLDDESKKKAREILEEAQEIENEGTATDEEMLSPENEYYFDHIHSDEEAKAFIKAYNQRNRIKKGRLPSTHEGLIMRLAVIYSETQKKK